MCLLRQYWLWLRFISCSCLQCMLILVNASNTYYYSICICWFIKISVGITVSRCKGNVFSQQLSAHFTCRLSMLSIWLTVNFSAMCWYVNINSLYSSIKCCLHLSPLYEQTKAMWGEEVCTCSATNMKLCTLHTTHYTTTHYTTTHYTACVRSCLLCGCETWTVRSSHDMRMANVEWGWTSTPSVSDTPQPRSPWVAWSISTPKLVPVFRATRWHPKKLWVPFSPTDSHWHSFFPSVICLWKQIPKITLCQFPQAFKTIIAAWVRASDLH